MGLGLGLEALILSVEMEQCCLCMLTCREALGVRISDSLRVPILFFSALSYL